MDKEILNVFEMTNKEAQIIIGNIPVYPDDCYSIPEYQVAKAMAIQALEQQVSEDCISRESLKRKLQENHDFFVNAYGGFSNLPQNDKSRVDEIDNCIAMVVNEPPVTPERPKGKWIDIRVIKSFHYDGEPRVRCSCCGDEEEWSSNYCPNCGAKMEGDYE